MNSLVRILARTRLLKGDLDLHLVRGSMVLIFLLFGYQKWWEYERCRRWTPSSATAR